MATDLPGPILLVATKSHRLTKNDITVVRKEVFPAASKWYDLGLELHLGPDYLNTLRSKTDQESLRELLLHWLSRAKPEPTWEVLCEALRNQAINHELLAEEIEKKFCKYDSVQDKSSEVVAAVDIFQEELTTHSQIDVHMDDHNVVSSFSTPIIESTSFEVSILTQEDIHQPRSILKSRSESSTKSMANKSPQKLKGNTVSPAHRKPNLQHNLPGLLGHKPDRYLPDPLPPSYHPPGNLDYELSTISQTPLILHEQHQTRKEDTEDREFVDNILPTLIPSEVHNKSVACPRPRSILHRRLSLGTVTVPSSRKLSTPRSKSFSEPKWTTAFYQGTEYKFINKPAVDLLCQKCNNIADEPHQMKCCSSLFCKSCILVFPEVCCKESGRSTPDGRSKKRIQQMTVVCPNATFGCSWIGKLKDVPKHRLECQREFILCPYSKIGCNKKVYRCDVNDKRYNKIHQQFHQDLLLEKIIGIQQRLRQQDLLLEKFDEMQECLRQQECVINSLKEELKKLKDSK